MPNIYEHAEALKARIEAGDHRGAVGGLWEEMGAWQFEFCRSMGLTPDHRLLDIGCGSLRGGVYFVEYLEANHYAGVDAHQALLDAGYTRELKPRGLKEKLDRSRLVATERFDFSRFEERFDLAIAQSVFTHLSLNQIRLCLSRLGAVMAPGGRLFATYFEAPAEADLEAEAPRGGGIVTRFEQNPFHYSVDDLKRAADGLGLHMIRLGDVGHPRGQYMLEVRFPAQATETDERNATRALNPDEALELKAGADHYRAYVGPPRRFDFMSSTQFALLHTAGLREEDTVLDVGCGSLRLGRVLIPFLREGRYCGVDPNAWLIEEGIRRELGRDAVELKAPRFSHRDDFDFSEFDEKFDYIIAQSIATHTGPDLLQKLIRGAASALEEDGLFLFSYIRNASPAPAEPGWHYPACVEYTETGMLDELAAAGLHAKPIPWFHPAASWIIAARDSDCLPQDTDLHKLAGGVIERPTSDKGYVYKPPGG